MGKEKCTSNFYLGSGILALVTSLFQQPPYLTTLLKIPALPYPEGNYEPRMSFAFFRKKIYIPVFKILFHGHISMPELGCFALFSVKVGFVKDRFVVTCYGFEILESISLQKSLED